MYHDGVISIPRSDCRPSTAGDAGSRGMNGSRVPTSLPPQYTITVDWKPNLDIDIPETISDEQMEELMKPFPLPVLKVCRIECTMVSITSRVLLSTTMPGLLNS